MKSTRIKTLIGLAALGGLFWLLSQIGWTTILHHLHQVGLSGFLLLCAVAIIEACFDALALQQSVLRRVGFWSLLCLNQAGSAVNIMVPGEAGEVYKASLLSRHLPSREATSSILLWNLTSRLSKPIVILLAATLAFLWSPLGHEVARWSVVLAIGNIALFWLMTIGIQRGWIAKTLSTLARLIPFLKRLVAHIQEAEERSATFSKHHPRPYFLMLLFQTLARLTGLLVVWMALQLLNSNYSFALCALIYAGMELLTYLIALFPTRLGVTEGSTYLLFELLKLGGSFGAIFQIVLRIKQLVVTCGFLIGGLITRVVTRSFVIEETSS